MTGRIQARLQELGITLPTPPAPVASYVPTVRSGKQLFVSGQIPLADGKIAFDITPSQKGADKPGAKAEIVD